jgi:hypothetical protein
MKDSEAQKPLSFDCEAMSENKLDALICPPDVRIGGFSALAGIAVGTLTLAFADFNGRAVGLGVFASTDRECKILQVINASEKSCLSPSPITATLTNSAFVSGLVRKSMSSWKK